MKLAWTPEARAERKAIYAYIEANNPQAAIKLNRQFAQRAAQLLAHPLMGRVGRLQSTRELVVPPSFVLIYQIDGETIRILRVLHTARRWPPTPTAPSNDLPPAKRWP